MRFSIAATLAFATSVFAQEATSGFNVFTKPTDGEQVPAGSTYEIVWQHGAEHPGPITIQLIGGPKQDKQDILETLVSGYDAETESFSWSVDASLGKFPFYGLKLFLDSDSTIFQYSFPFTISGGGDDSGDDSSSSATPSETESATESATKPTKTGAVTTARTSTTFAVPSSTLVSSTVHGNLSTTAGPQTTITSVVTTGSSTPTQSSTSSVATNGVASLAAGSFAMLGGVAMAVLAL